MADVGAYFCGGKVVRIARQGYNEPVTIPKAPRSVVDAAIVWAVKEGSLWLTDGPTSLYAEDVPTGLLSDGARLQQPPEPIAANDVLPGNLPDAWSDGITTAHAISEALSARAGQPLPWATVRAAIDAASQGRLLERTEDSGPWPCNFDGARQVKVRTPKSRPILDIAGLDDKQPNPPAGVLVASAYLNAGQIQDLAEQIGEIRKAAVGHDLKVMVRIEVARMGSGRRIRLFQRSMTT